MVIVVQHETKKKKKILRQVSNFFVYFYACIGLLFFAVFLAIRLKLTNVTGAVDSLDSVFANHFQNTNVLASETSVDEEMSKDTEFIKINDQIIALNKRKEELIRYLCNIKTLSSYAPKNIQTVIDIRKSSNSFNVANQMMFLIKTHLPGKDQLEAEVNNCYINFKTINITEKSVEDSIAGNNTPNIFLWPDKKEWSIIIDSVTKDKEVIDKAALVAKIEPRLIVSNLVVEQLRLYFTQRELYKKFFEPLKILANANKFSLGVMSIKEETAVAIEDHLKDKGSEYYLGPEYENLLDYPPGVDKSAERYKRLTTSDHYLNYLYGALYLKQFITQWEKAGYDLTKRPEILCTLFNVGFPQSKPNPEPKVGGSAINIDKTSYSFGRLAYEFYYSGEMYSLFPYLNHL